MVCVNCLFCLRVLELLVRLMCGLCLLLMDYWLFVCCVLLCFLGVGCVDCIL